MPGDRVAILVDELGEADHGAAEELVYDGRLVIDGDLQVGLFAQLAISTHTHTHNLFTINRAHVAS